MSDVNGLTVALGMIFVAPNFVARCCLGCFSVFCS